MISSIRNAIAICFLSITIFGGVACMRHSNEVKISGSVTIDGDWVEIRPSTPLKANKDLHMILLELEPPYRNDFYKEGEGPNRGAGILMPDGDVINPQIEVIDRLGNKFNLVYTGSRGFHSASRGGAPAYNLPYPTKWPTDREYAMVRIRSPRPIACKAIYWFAESNKDRK